MKILIEFAHNKHPMNLEDYSATNPPNPRKCEACSEEISDSTSFYSCTSSECGYTLHQLCGELPQELKFDLHPNHPLKLERSGFKSCSVCDKYCSGSFIYHCRKCNYNLDIICATVASRNIFHRSHSQHFLTFNPRPRTTHCDACGVSHEGQFYCCNTCVLYTIHRDCASFPKEIKLDGLHGHPLLIAYSEMPGHMCEICYGKIDTRRSWLYCCKGCKFFAHLKCVQSPEGIKLNRQKPTIEHQNNGDLPVLPTENLDNQLATGYLVAHYLKGGGEEEDDEEDEMDEEEEDDDEEDEMDEEEEEEEDWVVEDGEDYDEEEGDEDNDQRHLLLDDHVHSKEHPLSGDQVAQEEKEEDDEEEEDEDNDQRQLLHDGHIHSKEHPLSGDQVAQEEKEEDDEEEEDEDNDQRQLLHDGHIHSKEHPLSGDQVAQEEKEEDDEEEEDEDNDQRQLLHDGHIHSNEHPLSGDQLAQEEKKEENDLSSTPHFSPKHRLYLQDDIPTKEHLLSRVEVAQEEEIEEGKEEDEDLSSVSRFSHQDQLFLQDHVRTEVDPLLVDEVPQEKEEDKEEDQIPQKEEGDLLSISHFSHQHRLFLQDHIPTEEHHLSGDHVPKRINCIGCAQQITTPFYNCKDCNFFLHNYCAEISSFLDHPSHPEHRMILVKETWDENNLFRCSCCARYCNGFAYRCKESCEFKIDILCACLPTKVHHRSHHHSLVLRPRNGGKSKYGCCNSFWGDGFVYGCKECTFQIHIQCAVLPAEGIHRYDDDHTIKLTYSQGEIEGDEFFCDICEKDLDPKRWFYNCSKCELFMHPECILQIDRGSYSITL